MQQGAIVPQRVLKGVADFDAAFEQRLEDQGELMSLILLSDPKMTQYKQLLSEIYADSLENTVLLLVDEALRGQLPGIEERYTDAPRDETEFVGFVERVAEKVTPCLS